MVWPDIQFWLGFLIFFCGLSLHRIGPAFKRSNSGKPLILLGFILTFLPSGQLSSIENDFYIFMLNNLPWIFLSSSGIYFILFGSQIYWENIKSIKILGLLLILSSWIYFFTFIFGTFDADLFLIFANIIGMLFAFFYIIWAIKYIESRTPNAAESLPLSESEKKYVTSILIRNLGGNLDED
jgi:hypothetical protein